MLSMTLKGTDIVGAKVISVKENTEMGKIKDIIYDPKKNKIIAVLLSEGDVLTEPKVIPFSEIQDITKEAVLVKSSQSVKLSSKVIKPFSTPNNSDTYMKDTTIITESGKELGQEEDIVFDTQTGQVQKFEVRKGDQIQQVKISKIVTSSKSTTVVKEGEPAKTAKQDTGILEKVRELVSK